MYKIKLQNIDTRAPKKLDKEHVKKETEKLKLKLEALQNLMYAEGKHSLLVILQGMDASGKDGTIKHVFERVNPMGCRVIPFKKPTELEAKHDFLWRIHQQVPEKGFIHIFNRSHYEDVLVQRVHKWVSEKIIKERFESINNFEKLLTQTGTHILKFYLHVSKEEQLERLDERMKDKAKMWKYNEDDLKERELWSHYMKAYEDAFAHCSTPVKWEVVPADQNWYKEFIVAQRIVETLESLNMKYTGFKKSDANF